MEYLYRILQSISSQTTEIAEERLYVMCVRYRETQKYFLLSMY